MSAWTLLAYAGVFIAGGLAAVVFGVFLVRRLMRDAVARGLGW